LVIEKRRSIPPPHRVCRGSLSAKGKRPVGDGDGGLAGHTEAYPPFSFLPPQAQSPD
jgi:hypothetical protein